MYVCILDICTEGRHSYDCRKRKAPDCQRRRCAAGLHSMWEIRKDVDTCVAAQPKGMLNKYGLEVSSQGQLSRSALKVSSQGQLSRSALKVALTVKAQGQTSQGQTCSILCANVESNRMLRMFEDT